MAQNQIEILIKARDEASAAIKKLDSQIGALGGTTKTAATGLGSMTMAVAAGTAIYNVAASAITGMATSLGGMVTEAIEAQSAMASYELILRQGAGASTEQVAALNAQAEAIARVGGVNDDFVRQLQGTIAEYNISTEGIMKLTPALVDYAARQKGAAATTQDATLIANGFGKAMQGQMDVLTKGGFKYTDAQLKILKMGDEMEKTKVIADILGTSYDGMNKALGDTVEGSMRKFDNAISNIRKNIGGAFLPTLNLFLTDMTDVATKTEDATNKSDSFARTIYGVGSGVKAAGFVLAGTAQLIMGVGATLVSVAVVAGAFVYDLVSGFGKIWEAAKQLGTGIGKLFTGDFAGAAEAFKASWKGMSEIQLTTTKTVMDNARNAMGGFAKAAEDNFNKAGAAMAEGVIQKGFKPIVDAAKKSPVPSIIPSGTGDKGKAELEKIAKAADDFKEKLKSWQGDLTDLIKDYTKRSADQLDSYNAKVSDIQANIAKQRDDFAKESADKEAGYQQSVVQLYVKQQDEIKKLAESREKLNEKVRSGEGNSEDFNNLYEMDAELKKRQKELEAFTAERADIADAAAKERNVTDLERLKAKHTEEMTELAAQNQERMDALNKQLTDEKTAYDKAKADLIESTTDKYVKLNEEVQKGWDKIIKDTEGKITTMKGLEAQFLSLKSSIEGAKSETAAGGTVSIAGARADGGSVATGKAYLVGERGPELFVPSQNGTIIPNGGNGGATANVGGDTAMNINIMQGSNITVRNDSDIDAIAKSVSKQLANVLRDQRNGLATAS